MKSERKGTIKLREDKTLAIGADVMSDLAGLRRGVTGWVGQGCCQKPEEESGRTGDTVRAQALVCLDNTFIKVTQLLFQTADQGRASAGGEGELFPQGSSREPKQGSGGMLVLLMLLPEVPRMTRETEQSCVFCHCL